MIGGLELFELNEDLGHYFGASSGVLVLSVPPAKDGAKDGLLPGDVLRSIDGRPVASIGGLREPVERRAERGDVGGGAARRRASGGADTRRSVGARRSSVCRRWVRYARSG